MSITTIGLILVVVAVIGWAILPLVAERSIRADQRRESAEQVARDHVYGTVVPLKSPTYVLTDEGVLIPDVTSRERELLRETPEQWAEKAAGDIQRQAGRAHYFATKTPPYPGHPWVAERAQLVNDGLEQWLLWMERDTRGDDR